MKCVRKKCSKRQKEAFIAKTDKGAYIGGLPPYGYTIGQSDDGIRRLIVDDVTAKIVVRIYDMYLNGQGVTKISRTLTEEGIVSPKNGKRWHGETISRILKNATYTGDTIYNNTDTYSFREFQIDEIAHKHITNTHEAIIIQDDFLLANELMSQVHTSKKKISDIFNGLMVCYECGSNMWYLSDRHKYICGQHRNEKRQQCLSGRVDGNDLYYTIFEALKEIRSGSIKSTEESKFKVNKYLGEELDRKTVVRFISKIYVNHNLDLGVDYKLDVE